MVKFDQRWWNYIPDKHFITRTLNHLFPLEIPLTINDNVNQECVEETSVDEVADNGNVQSIRGAALQAQRRITEMLNDEATTVCFSFPQECHAQTDTDLRNFMT